MFLIVTSNQSRLGRIAAAIVATIPPPAPSAPRRNRRRDVGCVPGSSRAPRSPATHATVRVAGEAAQTRSCRLQAQQAGRQRGLGLDLGRGIAKGSEQGEFGPEWGEVVELAEENWYFKLSEHAEWLHQAVSSGAIGIWKSTPSGT